jgi:hypothetical protein
LAAAAAIAKLGAQATAALGTVKSSALQAFNKIFPLIEQLDFSPNTHISGREFSPNTHISGRVSMRMFTDFGKIWRLSFLKLKYDLTTHTN